VYPAPFQRLTPLHLVSVHSEAVDRSRALF
jgi:hypothetical protein